MMKADKATTARPKLYPDLREFYTHSSNSDGVNSSTNTKPHSSPPPASLSRPAPRMLPSAPPPKDARHNLLQPHEDIPEEPEKDYMQDDEHGDLTERITRSFVNILVRNASNRAETRYTSIVARSSSSRVGPSSTSILNNNHTDHLEQAMGDLTVDYSLDNITLDDLLELEPDYDMDDDLHFSQNNLNNLNQLTAAPEKKVLHQKNIEVVTKAGLPPPPPRTDQDFNAWMSWRMRANKVLAGVILERKGRPRDLRESEEIRPKPLARRTVEHVVQRAWGRSEGESEGERRRRRGSADQTSLPACPYVMYGIPRVSLTSTP